MAETHQSGAFSTSQLGTKFKAWRKNLRPKCAAHVARCFRRRERTHVAPARATLMAALDAG